MKILLDEKESQQWLDIKAREKILEETSRFPQDMKLPANCKLPIKPLTDSQRAEIIRMHEEGIRAIEISERLLLPAAQVRGCMGGHTKRKIKKYPSEKATAWIEEASQKLAAKETYITPKPVIDYIEAHQEHVAKTLDAEVVSMSDDNENVTEAVTEALRILVGDRYSIVYIRDKLNREFGRNYTKDDIVKMRSEL
jgi:hypothetical protein